MYNEFTMSIVLVLFVLSGVRVVLKESNVGIILPLLVLIVTCITLTQESIGYPLGTTMLTSVVVIFVLAVRIMVKIEKDQLRLTSIRVSSI